MKYKPSRDILQACRELQTLSPSKIREWIKSHRTKLDKTTGKRVQHSIEPQAISMWFKRHPQVYEQLQKEIVEEELPKDAITETLFQKEVFQEIPCIKQWIMDLTLRDAKPRTINNFVSYIKRLCQGRITKTEILENWGLKHPRNLTVEDAKKFIFEMKQRKMHSRNARLAFRNFFRSRGDPEREINKISGAEEGVGKYAHLYAPKEKLYKIFQYLQALNEDAYRASFFAFKTACRSGATLTAEYKNINKEEQTILVYEKASKGQPKRRLEKIIPPDLWDTLQLHELESERGKLFNIESPELNALLRSAYQEIIPELAKEIPMPFQFWRHQFAQHMLRALDWNYAFVAQLGGWKDERTLKRYYGMPSKEVIRQAGLEALPRI